MEEILASIRKIISEDSSDSLPSHQDGDVLELTQEVLDEPTPPPMASATVSVPPPPPPVATPPSPQNDVVFVSNEESPVSNPARDDAAPNDGIFSDKARKAIDDAFANLDQPEAPHPAPAKASPVTSMPAVEGNSVEAVFERAVRASVEPLLNQWMDNRKDDLLLSVKPMIREWMDEHFPAILEGAVRDEVARVAKTRGR